MSHDHSQLFQQSPADPSVRCLQVPAGGSERMKEFPPLVPQELRLEGRGYLEAAADITLSSAGKHAALESSGPLPAAS